MEDKERSGGYKSRDGPASGIPVGRRPTTDIKGVGQEVVIRRLDIEGVNLEPKGSRNAVNLTLHT